MSRQRVMFLATLALVACGGGSGAPGTSVVPAPVGLTYATPPPCMVGTAITPLTPTVTGAVASYSVSPALPAGLALNTTSGQITGTPTAVAATSSYTITAQNAGGSTTFSLQITVNPAALFWLEPTTATTIGIGQSINLFAALKSSAVAPFPAYIDAAQVSWASSQPGYATVSSRGLVTGLNDGTTTITAQYQTYSSQLTVQVGGTWLQRSVAVPGQGIRRYSIYIPPFGSNTSAQPLLLSLHGGGGSAMVQAASSQLAKFAFERQFYVAFLEGTGLVPTYNAGNCCGTAQTQNIDDVLYARLVLDDIRANYPVDAARVYATGFSNGAMMSHRLACGLADRLAGIAAVSGGSAEFDRSHNSYFTCSPSRPIPVLHIHATNDRNYPFAGGVGDGLSSTDFYSVDATIADWRVRNNVTAQAAVENVTATTTCYRYGTAADPNRPSAPVTLCKLDPPDVYDAVNRIVFGGGHSWPGGVRSPAANSDVPVTDFNANAYLWNFLNR